MQKVSINNIEREKLMILLGVVGAVLIVSGAHAAVNWTAYNDCHTNPLGFTHDNVTRWTIYTGNTNNYTGLLKDFETGSSHAMPVVTFTMVGTLGSSGSAAANPDPNTDAYEIFDGKVDFSGNIVDSESAPGWAQEITFTGLDPNMTYTFVGTAIRAKHYPYREALVTILGHVYANNNSSEDLVTTRDTTILQPGDNSSPGYVVRWDDISPGADGSFTIRSEDAPGGEYKSYPINGFMLQKFDPSGNRPPTVDAGSDHVLVRPEHTVSLDATVTDDGVGDPNGFLALEWSKITGPGEVSFDPNVFVEDPCVTFLTIGYYELILSATDGEFEASDTVAITINEPNHSPYPPILIGPADGEPNVSLSPLLEVMVSDPDEDIMDITFYGRRIPGTEDSFTIIVIPDTQCYSDAYPEIFTVQTSWIANEVNDGSRNIVFVTHVGDIVEHPDSVVEWDRARESMSVLDPALLNLGDPCLPEPVVPYAVIPGNHDQPTVLYNQYFPYTRYEGVLPWYGGHYGNKNDSSYQLFRAGGEDYIILHIEFCPKTDPDGNDVLDWGNFVLQEYADRKAIIVTHGFINEFGERTVSFCSDTQYIWDALVVPNDNVWFVLCGHNGSVGEALRTDIVNGHPVYQLLSCYQRRSNGGNGWLRIMRFVPEEDRVYIETYSPWLDQYETDENSQFDLDFPMGDVFAIIDSVNDVPNGTNASVEWLCLSPYTEYEWYVTITDATERTTVGPVWRFTTGPALEPSSPDPCSGAGQVDINTILTWIPGEDAVFHDVYFGMDNPPSTLIATDLAEPVCDPTPLDGMMLNSCTTYHWQVVGKTTGGQMPGPVWQFKTGLAGDFDSNNHVCFLDLQVFISQWLDLNCSGSNWCDGADINRNNEVNLKDFAILSQYWLQSCED